MTVADAPLKNESTPDAIPPPKAKPDWQKLERIRTLLLYEQPFYALMSQRCRTRWTEAVKTAGVRVTPRGDVELAIAPSFFASLSDSHSMGLFMHEMLHLLMDHPYRGRGLEPQIANIAMDIAINQLIPETLLPPKALLPGSLKLEPNRAFEHYYAELMKTSKCALCGKPAFEEGAKEERKESQGSKEDQKDHERGNGQGEGEGHNHDNHDKDGGPCQGHDLETLDNHDWDQENGELSSELRKEAIQKIAKSALRDTKERFRGKTPTHLEPLIAAMNDKPTIDWRQQLRHAIGRQLSQTFESTRSRPNRRWGYVAEGKKRAYFPRIVVGMDQSGSVSDSDCAAFFAELRSILKNAEDGVEVVYFDAAVAKVETLKGAMSLKPERHACGGTDFTPLIVHARVKKPDLLIVLTDGGAPAPEVKEPCPIVWAIVGGMNGDHLPGRKVVIKGEG